jgi:adenosylhomocysteinase
LSTQINSEKIDVDAGKRKIEWARSTMPLLARIAEDFLKTRPFEGLRIGVSLHIEQKTAVLMLTLKAGGAEVFATGNLGTTQDDIAAALNEMGVVVYGKRADAKTEHLENVKKVMRHEPNLLLDNGADLIHLAVHDDEFAIDEILGGTEETTSGGFRMREEMPGEVPFPIIVINDSPLKLIIENKHGVGQSIVESFNRITNLMTSGKRVAVFGYGWCGRGIAKYFQHQGAQVSVVDTNPIVSLEAAVDGFKVRSAEDAVVWADVIITATGRKDVIKSEFFIQMKDGVVLGNAGHFDFEIDTPTLREQAQSVEAPAEGIERFTMPNEKRIVLLCEGRMYNLGGLNPKGNTMECMDMGFALQALSQECVVNAAAQLVAGPQPVPDAINKEVATRMLASLE